MNITAAPTETSLGIGRPPYASERIRSHVLYMHEHSKTSWWDRAQHVGACRLMDQAATTYLASKDVAIAYRQESNQAGREEITKAGGIKDRWENGDANFSEEKTEKRSQGSPQIQRI